MTHEGFHFFGQQLKKIIDLWPEGHPEYTGVSDQSRSEMQTKCFHGSLEIENLVKIERESILASFLSIQAGNKLQAKTSVNEFIQTRKSRYKILSGVQISDPFLPQRSCEEVENNASLAEGIPEFIGIGTLLKLGLLSANQVADYFPDTDNAFYYRFPLFQSLIISTDFPNMILDVLNDPNNGIEKKFEAWADDALK